MKELDTRGLSVSFNEKSGKIYLPKSIRDALALDKDDKLYIRITGHSSMEITVGRASLSICRSCGALYDPSERNYYICESCRT